MDVPNEVTADHVIEAMNKLDQGAKVKVKKSIHYDLLHNGKRCTPKAVIALAVADALASLFTSSLTRTSSPFCRGWALR